MKHIGHVFYQNILIYQHIISFSLKINEVSMMSFMHIKHSFIHKNQVCHVKRVSCEMHYAAAVIFKICSIGMGISVETPSSVNINTVLLF